MGKQSGELLSLCRLTVFRFVLKLVDRVFTVQSSVTLANLDTEAMNVLATRSPNEVDAFKRCVASGVGTKLVNRDIAAGRELAVTSTPTIFINGRRVLNINSEQALQDVIKSFLAEKAVP